jgi:hypothetical protein
MKIIFDPDPQTRAEGVTSSISWDNRALQDAIQRIFCPRDGEKIAELRMTPKGITAKFEWERRI